MADYDVLHIRVPLRRAILARLLMNNWWAGPNVSGLRKSGWISRVVRRMRCCGKAWEICHWHLQKCLAFL